MLFSGPRTPNTLARSVSRWSLLLAVFIGVSGCTGQLVSQTQIESVTVTGEPVVGRIVTLHVEVFSTEAHPSGEVRVEAPSEPVMLLSGSDYTHTVLFETPFLVNQPQTFDVPFCVLQPGAWSIGSLVGRRHLPAGGSVQGYEGTDVDEVGVQSSETAGVTWVVSQGGKPPTIRETTVPRTPAPTAIPAAQCSAAP